MDSGTQDVGISARKRQNASDALNQSERSGNRDNKKKKKEKKEEEE